MPGASCKAPPACSWRPAPWPPRSPPGASQQLSMDGAPGPRRSGGGRGPPRRLRRMGVRVLYRLPPPPATRGVTTPHTAQAMRTAPSLSGSPSPGSLNLGQRGWDRPWRALHLPLVKRGGCVRPGPSRAPLGGGRGTRGPEGAGQAEVGCAPKPGACPPNRVSILLRRHRQQGVHHGHQG